LPNLIDVYRYEQLSELYSKKN